LKRYRTYLLYVLLAILACNYVDRIALALVLEDIKTDLHLSDTQLGLLTGIAFALFYSVMGIPIARWADRGNRISIISLTTALWGVMLGLFGCASTFLQLVCIRVGIAVGEAGCIPPAHSLIADHFKRAERPRAVARYMLGGPLASIFGYFVAGWLNQRYGWRAMFMLIGVPGVLLALLAWCTLKEPRRHGRLTASGDSRDLPDDVAEVATTPSSREPPALGAVLGTLGRNVTFRHLVFGLSMLSFFMNGLANWQPTFFVRSFGMSTAELGVWLSLIYGIAALAGTYLGGEWAVRYALDNEQLQLRLMALAQGAFGLISVFIYVGASRYVAFSLLALGTLTAAMTSGPLFATIQSLVPEAMRATSVALIYLFANLIGLGLGPLAVGALSDAFTPWAGEDSLRYALLAMSPGFLWAAWHLWQAGNTVARDIEPALQSPQA
jgi:predicted MFS family arabinose efflux permease